MMFNVWNLINPGGAVPAAAIRPAAMSAPPGGSDTGRDRERRRRRDRSGSGSHSKRGVRRHRSHS